MSRSNPHVLTILLTLLVAGCVSYEPAPFDPEAVLARELELRSAVPAGRSLTLAEAVASMRARNPRLREAWAAYATEAAVAHTPTPLPNPSLSVGPIFLEGAEILGSSHYGVEAALGWTVLLSGTRAIKDDLNEARAYASFLVAAGEEREEYLRLRADLATLAFLSNRLSARQEVLAALTKAVEAGRQLIEAALATALDLRILELEAARAESGVISEEGTVIEARARLSGRAGLSLAAFPSVASDSLASLPSAVPSLEELRRTMLRDHPVLNALRARYLVAEQALKHEVALQFPSLGLGPSYEREEKVDRFGFPFGIDLPLFDRNQQGIAAARAGRDEIRIQFEAAVEDRLGAIESIRERLLVAQRRLDLLRSKIGPMSRQTIDLARQALPAGGVDALRFLEVLRADREVRLDLVAAELEVYTAWTDLEQACGAPLLAFPGEPGLSPLPAAPSKEDS